MSDITEAELTQSALLKLERAKQHIYDLDRKLSEYLANEPFRLRVRQNKERRERLVYVHANPPIPEAAFALIVGDAVHNMRTALDHLCFKMVGDKAPNAERVGFPFAKTADGLDGAIKTRQMHVAPKQVIDELHALQPYASGNTNLNAVKVLDERDKHHFVLTVAYSMQLRMDQLATLVGGELEPGLPPDMTIGTSGGFILSLEEAEADESFDKDADFQPSFNVGFGQGETLSGLPIVAVLKNMLVATEDAILRLTAAYFR